MTGENTDYSYLLDILKLAEAGEEKTGQEKFNITFSGDFFNKSQTAEINEELASVMSKDSTYNLSLFSRNLDANNLPGSSPLSEKVNLKMDNPDFVISHYDNPVMMLPANGHWLIFNNWSYGSLPIAWQEAFSDYADEIWVPSNYHRNCFINSSLSSQKIRVINTGIDSLVFNPHVTPENLKTDKRIKFLYHGDLDWDSGFDVLLKAYSEEFFTDQEVCLIVATDVNKIDPQMKDKIDALKKDSENPEIIFYHLPKTEKKAELYKAVSFFVSPFRTETYCHNIIEAMACGIPAIVTDFGAVKDYCSSENSLMIPAEITYQQEKKIKEMATLSYPSWATIEVLNLRVILRNAVEMTRDEYNQLSKNSYKRIIDNFTWIKINDLIKEALTEIKQKPIKREQHRESGLKILEGLKKLNQSDLQGAADSFLEADPDNQNVNFYLANISLYTGKLNEALGYILKSLQKNPDNDDYYNIAGVVLYKMGQYNEAKNFFDKVLSLNPDHSGAKESLRAITENAIDDSIQETPELKRIKDFSHLTNPLKFPTLSVCIIAKNEQGNIQKTIDSVKEIADEVIVLDTGSDDDTIKVSEKSGAQVYQYSWENSFAKARNEAMKLAKMDWILMLDADEFIPEEVKTSIKPTLFKCNPEKIYLPRVLNIINNNHSGDYLEHYVARLIPNHRGIKFVRDLHEIPVAADGSFLESENLKGLDIYHYGYRSDIVKAKNKNQRNRIIIEKMIAEEPENPINYYYLSQICKDEGNYSQITEWSQKGISLSEQNKNEMIAPIIRMLKIKLIESLIFTEDFAKAETNALEFKEDLQERPDFWFLWGNIAIKLGKYEQAIDFAKKALKLRGKDIYPSVDLGTATWKPLSVIALAYYEKNEPEQAIKYYKKALKENPDNLQLHYQLSKIYVDQGNIEQIESYFNLFSKLIVPEELLAILRHIEPVYLEKNLEEKFYNHLETIRISLIKTVVNVNIRKIFQELVQLYQKILTKKPDFSAVKYSLACCYSMLEQQDKAEELFTEIINSDEFEVDSLHNLATFAFNRGDLGKAEDLYKKVLEIDEFHTETYVSLTKMEINRQNFVKAREYLDELKTIDPDNKELTMLEMKFADSQGEKKLAADLYSAMLFNRF